MTDLMTKEEATKLLPAWSLEPRATSARALRTVIALADEVAQLRAVVEDPGDMKVTFPPSAIPDVLRFYSTITLGVESNQIRDHLRARLRGKA